MNLVQIVFTVLFIIIGIRIAWRVLCATLASQRIYFLGFKNYLKILRSYKRSADLLNGGFPRLFKSVDKIEEEIKHRDRITESLEYALKVNEGLSKGLTFRWVRPAVFTKPPDIRNGYVYVIQDIEITGFYKIGRSVKPEVRLSTFEVKLPFKIKKVCTIPSNDCVKLEKELHRIFKSKRRNGEWFELSDEDVQSILSLT